MRELLDKQPREYRDEVLQAKFGFTTEHIVATARAQLGLDHDADAPAVTLETTDQ